MEEVRALPSLKTALELLEGGCKDDAPVDCSDLARLHGTLGDHDESYRMHKKACRLGDTPSCLELALSCSDRGDCQQQYASFCKTGGDLYVCAACLAPHRPCGDGPGATETMELLEQACDAGVGDGCFHLRDWASDPAREASLLQKACDHASLLGCQELAGHPGEAVLELEGRRCLLGDTAMCHGPPPLPY